MSDPGRERNMRDYWQDSLGTVIQGPRPGNPGDVTITNGGQTRPGWYNGSVVEG